MCGLFGTLWNSVLFGETKSIAIAKEVRRLLGLWLDSQRRIPFFPRDAWPSLFHGRFAQLVSVRTVGEHNSCVWPRVYSFVFVTY
jgi:hypothetical protein